METKAENSFSVLLSPSTSYHPSLSFCSFLSTHPFLLSSQLDLDSIRLNLNFASSSSPYLPFNLLAFLSLSLCLLRPFSSYDYNSGPVFSSLDLSSLSLCVLLLFLFS